LRSLLAPGGTLMLVESTHHHAWFDMTTGLIEGWQRFDDGIRGDNPLLRPDQWAAVLVECGFVRPTAFPAADSVASAIGQHVVSAHAPGDAVVGSLGLDAITDPASTAMQVSRPGASSEWAGRIAQASSGERHELLRDLVREHVARALKVEDPSSLSTSDRLMDMGMDSLMAVQLRNGLARSLALPRALPATLMFDHPTIGDIAEFLAGKIDGPRGDGVMRLAESPEIAALRPMAAAEVLAMSDEDIARVLDERLGGA
jgi:acyl carrier protein